MSFSRRRMQSDKAFTLLEIVISLAVLAIILVPLTMSFMASFQRTTEVGNRISATADAQRIAAAWTKDVQNVDPAGVRQGEAGCLPDPGGPSEVEVPLITFEWDTQTSTGTITSTSGSPTTSVNVVPKKATWSIVGTGSQMRIMRRYCEADAPATGADGTPPSMMIADSFWVPGKTPMTLVYGQTSGLKDFCTGTACTININGAFTYSLTIGRRVPGLTPGLAQVPSVPVITGAVPGNASLAIAWLPSTVPSGAPPVDRYTVVISRQFNGTELSHQDLGSTSLAALFTGLTNGLDYYFQAQACNLNGCSDLSPPFGPVQPAPTIPGPPTGVTASRTANQTLGAAWTAPADNGGTAITSYRIRARVVDTGEVANLVDTGSSGVTGSIGSLTPGVNYVVTVAAVNSVGEGPESLQSDPIVVCSTPGAPPQAPRVSPNLTIGASTDIAWDALVDNGCPITTYRILSDPSPETPEGQTGYNNTFGWNSNSTNRTYTTPRLPANAHRFKVAGVNELGVGTYSDWSVYTTSPTTPIPPQDINWEPTPPVASSPFFGYDYSIGGVKITWTPVPDLAQFNGGRPIIGYHFCITPTFPTNSCVDPNNRINGQNGHVVETNSGGPTTGGPTQITGTYPNESYKTYHTTVAAFTSAGDGDPASVDWIPGGRPIGSPKSLSAVGVNVGVVNLTWDVPDYSSPQVNGGSPISSTGGTRILGLAGFGAGGYPIDTTLAGTTSLGIAANATNTLSVAAHNAIGNSIPSESITVVGPSTITAPASAPTLTRPNGLGSGELQLVMTPFTYSTGNPTPVYTVTCTASGGVTKVYSNVLVGTTVLTGLTNGKSYTCTINALATFPLDVTHPGNPAATTSYTSAPTAAAIPFDNSGPPASLVATGPTAGKVHLVWTAPTNNGGSAITNYQISSSPALAGLPSEVSSSTLVYDSGYLQAGVQYTFSVAAKNGSGVYGTPATVTYTAPTSLPTATVQNVTWTPVATNSLTIAWDAVANTAPGNGGGTPTGYHVVVSPGPGLGAATTVNVPFGTNSTTINGLNQTTGTASTGTSTTLALVNYTVTVSVYNAVGDGPTTSINNVKSGGIPISSPANLGFVGYNSSGAIHLTWTQDPNTAQYNGGQTIKGYVIYGIPGYANGYAVGYSSLATDLGGFTAGSTYTLRVVWNNNPAFNASDSNTYATTGSSVGSTITFVAPGPPKISTDTTLGCTNVPASNPCRVRLTTPGSPAGRADLTFYFDVTPGSPPITGYTAQCTATGGVTVNLPNATNPAALKNANFANRIDGLTSGKTYTCNVTATNGPFWNSSTGSTVVASNTLVIP